MDEGDACAVGPGRGGPAVTAPAAAHARSGGALADATVPSTLALTCLTLAAAVGMGRLFEDTSYLAPFVVAAVVPHAVCWAGRRLGIGLGVTSLVALAGLGLAIAWMALPETTTLGLPGPGTLAAARRELARAAQDFGGIVAPAPVTKGFLVAGMGGVGLTAILGDWGAFRVRNLFEAALPSFGLFVVTSTLGTARHRTVSVGMYLGAILVFLLLHYAWLQSTSATWFVGTSARAQARRLWGGAVVGGTALAVALVLGPQLPGAGAPPLLDWREGNRQGDRNRTTVSPLVDIRGRLVDQAQVEVFTVRSNVRAYWRLTSLDTFDGEIWSFNDTHKPVEQRLPEGLSGDPPSEQAVQEFEIRSLASIWLPAAYRPERIEPAGGVSYNAALGSLVTRKQTSDGLEYRVQSSIPRPNSDGLRSAPGGATQPDLDRFLRLPPVSEAVRRLAYRIVDQAGATTPFARAMALQSFFQEHFAYDLAARPGHDGAALENFLFRTRRGYCEQFSGAYAVMARMLGLPTRVAVGFTPGEMGSDGRYHVRGLNAHAWPEVHLSGHGWVNFEPTPGRGPPGAQSYTGLPESQAPVDNPTTATTTAVPASPADTAPTTAAPGGGPGITEPAPGPTETVAGPDEPGQDERTLLSPVVVWFLVGSLAVAALVGAIPLGKRHRRRRRRAAAATPADRVLVAWTEGAEALAQAGAARRPSETLAEHADHALAAVPLPDPAASALRVLAQDATTAAYAPTPVTLEEVTRATEAAASVEAALMASASRAERLRRVLDPRPLLADPTGGAGRGPAARRRRRVAGE